MDLFWDGRASLIFNGVNPFGFRDPEASLKRRTATGVESVHVSIPFASLASQAVGPPLSRLEMSGHSRDFAEVARKLLAADFIPLAGQLVHPQDSVLGGLVRTEQVTTCITRRVRARPIQECTVSEQQATGLGVGYAQLIADAFKPEWWANYTDANDYTLMDDNFTLFFGIALQMYQSSLIADETPFDRYMGAAINYRAGGTPESPMPVTGDPVALTPLQKKGLEVFQQVGCTNCHALPETSSSVVRSAGIEITRGGPLDLVNVAVPQQFLELMPMGNGALGVYDKGFYNIGVRPTEEDIGRGNDAPTGFPLSYSKLALLKWLHGKDGSDPLPAFVSEFVPDTGLNEADASTSLEGLFGVFGSNGRTVTRGAFKTPMLRNQELQGPYFHSGQSGTLRHVVEFYARGGNFPQTNEQNLDADMDPIPLLDVSPAGANVPEAEANIQALVAFLSGALTDQRVINQSAPFDHPQLFVPEGVKYSGARPESIVELPATGAAGISASPWRFLNMDPQSR